jgi:hypothetical protein
MKTTDSMIGGTLRPQVYQPLADYFAKFIEEYTSASSASADTPRRSAGATPAAPPTPRRGCVIAAPRCSATMMP